MKFEQNVQTLKHKLQNYLIKDKQNHDKLVDECGAEASYKAYKEDLQRKQELLD